MDCSIVTVQELISNRKEVTEDEHGGELSAGDFFNRERMDPKKRYVCFMRALRVVLDICVRLILVMGSDQQHILC